MTASTAAGSPISPIACRVNQFSHTPEAVRRTDFRKRRRRLGADIVDRIAGQAGEQGIRGIGGNGPTDTTERDGRFHAHGGIGVGQQFDQAPARRGMAGADSPDRVDGGAAREKILAVENSMQSLKNFGSAVLNVFCHIQFFFSLPLPRLLSVPRWPRKRAVECRNRRYECRAP